MPGFNAREIRVIPVVVEEWNSYIFRIPNDVDNLLKKKKTIYFCTEVAPRQSIS